ncbi:MAG: hypothetical protein AB7P00_27995 [Sandaracinaceae bacterium]
MADDLVDLELTIPVGIAERSTAGTGAAPDGYGYARETGLLAGGEVRLHLAPMNRYFRLGVVAGAQHMAGPFFGLDGGYAMRTTLMDAGLAARTVLPCMSNDTVRWHVGGVLALTGMVADAGLGVGGTENGPDLAERRAAADALDHGGIGWRLAFDLTLHVESFLVGLALGVRQYFGIDTIADRTWLMDFGLRIGGRIDFTGERAY